MLTKTTLALTIVGTVAAQQAFSPVIPRWIDANKHGNGYVIANYWNGTYEYAGETSFSWDFDYNCARSYFEQYSDNTWAESTYCNNVATSYHSQYGCYTENVGYVNLENETKNWVNDFTINWGVGFTDPVWGLDNYQVLEHRTEWTYIYQRPADRAIEFIVDASHSQYDVVVYFPSGLTVDNTTYGVWDYEMKYGQCPNNATTFAFSKLFAPKSLARAHHKPANLRAKPRASGLAQEGGLRAIFKRAAPKVAAVAAPNKATFVLNKGPATASAKQSPLSMINRMAAPMSAVASDNDLEEEVDQVFDLTDSNDDDCIDWAELKFVIQMENEDEIVSDDMVNFFFTGIDTNADGCIDWDELYAFAKSQQVLFRGASLKSNLTRMRQHHFKGEESKLAQIKAFLSSFDDDEDDWDEDSDDEWDEEDYDTRRGDSLADEVQAVFDLTDSNNDGYISFDELKYAVSQEDSDVTDEEILLVIAFIDQDGDGQISYDELYDFAESQQPKSLLTK